MEIIPRQQQEFTRAVYILMSYFLGNSDLADGVHKLNEKHKQRYLKDEINQLRQGNTIFIQALADLRRSYPDMIEEPSLEDIKTARYTGYKGIDGRKAQGYYSKLEFVTGYFGLLCDWALEEVHRLVMSPYPIGLVCDTAEPILAYMEFSVPIRPFTRMNDIRRRAEKQIKQQWPEFRDLQKQKGYVGRIKPKTNIERDLYWLYLYLAEKRTSKGIYELVNDHTADYVIIERALAKWRKILRIPSLREQRRTTNVKPTK